MKYLSFIFILSIFYCSTYDKTETAKVDLKTELNSRIYDPFDTTKTVKVLFATVRKTAGSNIACSNEYYSIQYDPQERFGSCEVSVPSGHDVGNLDMDASGSSEKFYKLENHQTLNYDTLLSTIKDNKFPEVIVFVHGFNVKFEEAVLRAAQIRYDMKFSGEIVLFTWPAGADEGVLSSLLINSTYSTNQINAKASVNHFKVFLNKITALGKKTHLIVHSMGHQVVLPSVAGLSKEKGGKFISEMVLNAPDFDAAEFKEIAGDLKKSADRITVYCSPGDNALVASSKVNKNKRIGSCEKVAGIDMVNVNPVDSPVLGVGGLGHGYYSSRPILTDLYQVLLGVDVTKRLFIRKSSPQNAEDYVMRK